MPRALAIAVLALFACACAGCSIQLPSTFSPLGMHLVAEDRGWQISVAQLEGWRSGARILAPAGDGQTAIGSNHDFGWYADAGDFFKAMSSIGRPTQTGPPAESDAWKTLHDNDLRIFDLATGKQIRTMPADAAAAWIAAYESHRWSPPPADNLSPNGRYRLVRRDHTIEVRDTQSDGVLARMEFLAGLGNLHWLPDSRAFEAPYQDWKILRFTLPATLDHVERPLAPARLFTLYTDKFPQSQDLLAVSADGRRVWMDSLLWRAEFPDALQSLGGGDLRRYESHVMASPDGSGLLLFDRNGPSEIFALPANAPPPPAALTLQSVHAHANEPPNQSRRRVEAQWFTADGPRGLVRQRTSARDGTAISLLEFWNLQNDRKLWFTLAPYASIALSADGRTMVANENKICWLIDPATGAHLRQLNLDDVDTTFHSGGYFNLELSHDGHMLLITTNNSPSPCGFFDITQDRLLGKTQLRLGTRPPVMNAHGDRYLLITDDGVLNLFDTATQRTLARYDRPKSPILHAAFTDAGDLWTLSRDELCQWRAPTPADLAAQILPASFTLPWHYQP